MGRPLQTQNSNLVKKERSWTNLDLVYLLQGYPLITLRGAVGDISLVVWMDGVISLYGKLKSVAVGWKDTV